MQIARSGKGMNQGQVGRQMSLDQEASGGGKMARWSDIKCSKNQMRSKEKTDKHGNQETGLDDAAQTWPSDFLVILLKKKPTLS